MVFSLRRFSWHRIIQQSINFFVRMKSTTISSFPLTPTNIQQTIRIEILNANLPLRQKNVGRVLIKILNFIRNNSGSKLYQVSVKIWRKITKLSKIVFFFRNIETYPRTRILNYIIYSRCISIQLEKYDKFLPRTEIKTKCKLVRCHSEIPTNNTYNQEVHYNVKFCWK